MRDQSSPKLQASPVGTARPAGSGAGRWFSVGVAVGLLPILMMVLFGFTQCPLAPMGDYTCHDPNQGDGGWFFVAAVAAYLLQTLAMLVCFFPRRARPVAWGLLLMLFLDPIVGVYAFYPRRWAAACPPRQRQRLIVPPILFAITGWPRPWRVDRWIGSTVTPLLR